MKITRWVVNHPLWIILLVLFLTLFFGYELKNLKIETDISAALPKDLPAKRLYDEISEIFPSKDLIFVAVESDSIYTPKIVSSVERLTERILKIKGVYDVISPTNVDVIVGTEEGIEVVPALEGPPTDTLAIERMRKRLLESDFLGNLVSEDGRAFGIMVLLKSKTRPRDVAREILKLLREVREKEGLKVYATGRPVLEHVLAEGLLRDVHVFFTLVIIVIIFILFVSFRSLRGILLPFAVVILSVIWTMGFMALAGIKFSHSTEFMPVLLISIGIADGIHILHTYYQQSRKYRERRELVLKTMEILNVPVIMTSLTTAVAFLALGVAGFRSLRELGGTTAFGVIMAMFLSLCLIPAFLSILKVPKRAPEESHLRFLHSFMAKYGEFLIRKRKAVVLANILIILFLLIGFFKIRVENSTVENLRPDNEARIAYEIINRHFSGAEVLLTVVKTEERGILNPKVLKEMDRFKAHMLKNPWVGDVVSIADIIKRLNMVLHGNDSSYYRIPNEIEIENGKRVRGKDLIAQYLTLYSLSTKPGRLESMVTEEFNTAKISVFFKEGRRSVIYNVDRWARDFISRDFEDVKEVDLTGTPEIYLVINDMVVTGQAKSILLSLIFVSILVILSFRAFGAGFYGIIPLFFAMIVNFGFMGWTGIYANLENMVTSNIAIGVGVDYMIHFIHKMRLKLKEKGNYREALIETMNTSGVAIFLNAIAVALGFSTIMASSFKSVSQMGLLITLAMISTCYAALTILPVFIVTIKPKFMGGERK